LTAPGIINDCTDSSEEDEKMKHSECSMGKQPAKLPR
jgi:hypothetical protein